MATFRSRAQHVGTGGGSLTSTITLSKPAGTLNDDYLLAMFSIQYGSSALAVTAVPSGWTLLYASGAVSNGIGGFGYFWVYGKKAASEPASWSWTLNNSVAFFNCQAAAISDVNTATAYEQLGGTSAASKANASTISHSVDTTGSSETLATILLAEGHAQSWTESAGTEQFDVSNGSGDVVCLNFLSVASASHQSVTGTLATSPTTDTAAVAIVQLAFNPAAVNATVTAPAAAATASRAVPSAGPGIGAVPAAAVASYAIPPVITGAQTIVVVAGLATASRVAPHQSSSRIELLLPPDVGGTIELVEDP